jgi:hypothetical protein
VCLFYPFVLLYQEPGVVFIVDVDVEVVRWMLRLCIMLMLMLMLVGCYVLCVCRVGAYC